MFYTPHQTSTLNLHQHYNRIPTVFHQTYKNWRLPKFYEKYITTLLDKHCIQYQDTLRDFENQVFIRNAEGSLCYHYVFWSDASIMQLVKNRFPHLEELFQKYSNLERSDAARYLILHEFGGIYSDMDNEFIRPIDAAVEWGIASLFAHLPYVRQWPSLRPHLECTLMMSIPRHPFLRLLINSLNASRSAENVWYRTGPEFLTRLHQQFLSSDPKRTSDCRMHPHSRPDCAHVPLPVRVFYPFIYEPFAQPAIGQCKNFLLNTHRHSVHVSALLILYSSNV